nr:retrovirus-related Pol polyprotein from transposon TNT 1-94 [Tanacetum cinerariifolium]
MKCYRGSVLLGYNKECKIRGIGKVSVQLRDGLSFVLHDVRYIPKLKRNLISLGTLKNERYTVKLQSRKVKVINGSRVVLSGIRRDNCIYNLDGHAVAHELNASFEEKQSCAGLAQKAETYERGETTCVGKAWVVSKKEFRKAHSSGSDRICSFRLLEFVSGEIIGRTVRKLRIDNHLEFFNREFKQLCVKSGIARHLTISRMPQQNGLAEHMNRILMDKSDKMCFFRHPKGMNGYKLYRFDGESPKIVTSRNKVFNKGVMYKDTLKDSGASTNKSIKELQVKVELQRLNNHTLEKDQTDQEDGDDEDAGDQETDKTLNLTDYGLVRDREPKTRTKYLRFQDESNMDAYAFVVVEEEDTHESLTY